MDYLIENLANPNYSHRQSCPNLRKRCWISDHLERLVIDISGKDIKLFASKLESLTLIK